MRVALSFPGCHRRGGVERIVFECARFLAGQGHQVTVFASDWETDPSQPIRYSPVVHPRWPGFCRGAAYYRACTEALRTSEFDILNTHGCVCPLGGVHWVQSLHRAWLERSKQFRPPFSAGRLKQRLNPLHPVLLNLESRHFCERNYQRVIATTEDVKADLKHFYGVPSEDVVVIPNGFSPSEFNPVRRSERRDRIRASLGLNPDHIALLFVANELERKGYDTILDAMRVLNRPELRLLHVGRPKARHVLKRAESFGVASQVLACGPTDDVAGFHAAADIFVLPTQYEAFCLAILEALGSGLPVVSTQVPGARDAVRPGLNGALMGDPRSGEELASLLKPLLDAPVRDAMSAAAPRSVEGYQWPTVLRAYEDVLIEATRV